MPKKKTSEPTKEELEDKVNESNTFEEAIEHEPSKEFEQEPESQSNIFKEKLEKKKELPKFETVVDSIPFHNFEKEPIFTGFFIEKFKIADILDSETQHPIPFKALKFVDYNTGEFVALRLNHSILKAIDKSEDMENLKEGFEHLFNIEFLGKTMVKGKPFNQYKIGIAPVQVDLN